MAKSIPPWLPDWRDESQYPDPVDTSPQEWAWEYLRRNQEYQKKYQELATLLDKLLAIDTDLRQLVESDEARHYEDPFEFLTTTDIGKNYLGITPEALKFCQTVTHKFMIAAPGVVPNPALKYVDAKPEFLTTGVSVFVPRAKMMLPIDGGIISSKEKFLVEKHEQPLIDDDREQPLPRINKKPTELLFSVDLSFNLNPQIDLIKQLMKREKGNLQKLGVAKRITRKSEYNPDILVAYDAWLCGVTPMAIGNYILSPSLRQNPVGADKINKLINRAKELIKSDYIRLASIV